jgi:hypothetical protein
MGLPIRIAREASEEEREQVRRRLEAEMRAGTID